MNGIANIYAAVESPKFMSGSVQMEQAGAPSSA